MNCNRLKKIVPISTVLKDKGLLGTFRRQGERLAGPCPIHGGDNPNAFVITLNKNLWYCFSRCNCGGNIIDLVCKLDGINFQHAFYYLKSLVGHPKVPCSLPPHTAQKSFKPFSSKLPLNHHTQWLHSKKITPKTAAIFEAGAYYGNGFLANSIGVRLHDLDGLPLGYAARRLAEESIKRFGKWQFPPKLPKKNLLYNYNRVKGITRPCVVVTECPWGVMRLYQMNIPAVALLGIYLSDMHCNLLKNAKDIVLMLDGDHAGVTATKTNERKLKNHVQGQVHSVYLPDGIDPDDLTDNELMDRLNPFFF